ncbi:hypothetical protein EVAR_101200_1 [Eumeta japonica]|uniref:Uncharacterized protein n=1 Tax=Eumeta variegata TaxID=151549 RepID=A0A4C2AEX2_EUMVA|nr:hypothetical protein EVAR_101200_1 [Eumeta japonica]
MKQFASTLDPDLGRGNDCGPEPVFGDASAFRPSMDSRSRSASPWMALLADRRRRDANGISRGPPDQKWRVDASRSNCHGA